MLLTENDKAIQMKNFDSMHAQVLLCYACVVTDEHAATMWNDSEKPYNPPEMVRAYEEYFRLMDRLMDERLEIERYGPEHAALERRSVYSVMEGIIDKWARKKRLEEGALRLVVWALVRQNHTKKLGHQDLSLDEIVSLLDKYQNALDAWWPRSKVV
jgi:hypothetical protein